MSKKLWSLLTLFIMCIVLTPGNVAAMHIAEGSLPIGWCIFWGVLSLPFLYWGVVSVNKSISENPQHKFLLAVGGAFVFVLSALKLPSVTGSSSHPTGIGLGAAIFGPGVMTILGSIVLLLQAILLAHGGLTTLGANIFSMAIVGALTAFGIFRLGKKLGLPIGITVFAAAFAGDLLTYVTTAIQLALAHPAAAGGFMESFVKFIALFALTQIPLAISEGILTVIVFNMLSIYSRNELIELSALSEEV